MSESKKQPDKQLSNIEALRIHALGLAWFFSIISLSSSFGAVLLFALAAMSVTKRITIPLRKRFQIPAFALPVFYLVCSFIAWPLLVNSFTIQSNLNASNTVVEQPIESAPVNTPKPEPTPTPDPDVVAAGGPPQIDTLFGGYPQVKNHIKKELGFEPEYLKWFNPILERSCSDGRACWRVKTVIRKNGQEGGFYAFMRYGKIIDTKFESY